MRGALLAAGLVVTGLAGAEAPCTGPADVVFDANVGVTTFSNNGTWALCNDVVLRGGLSGTSTGGIRRVDGVTATVFFVVLGQPGGQQWAGVAADGRLAQAR